MSSNHYNTTRTRTFTHLSLVDREHIERWYNDENKTQAEIARLLNVDRSTISREIRRGTVDQIKMKNGHYVNIKRYFADTGQIVYNRNRQKQQVSFDEKYSKHFINTLKAAHENGEFKGKERKYNIKTFIHLYTQRYPNERVPSYKTLYRHIRTGKFFIKPADLPVMYRLVPRRNKHSHPKGMNKIIRGKSIIERPEEVMTRQTFGHWEADLVIGKKGKDEPAIITLVERKTRHSLCIKIKNTKASTVYAVFRRLLKLCKSWFQSITFDNGSEFALVSQLDCAVYFTHAYSAWERGTNENFNKILREFIPKGRSIHQYTQKEISYFSHLINERIREILGYRSANESFAFELKNFLPCTGEIVSIPAT